jgi:hypothetical protein
VCDCGSVRHYMAGDLTRTDRPTRSCGCNKSAAVRKARTKHGHTKHGGEWTPEYRTWAGIMGRCYTTSNKSYAEYGGAGILVCERWHDFANFLADMGPKPSLKHSIDRIDGTKGYEPGNCRWATTHQQANNVRTNVRLTLGGECRTIAEWSRHLNIPYSALRFRLASGWGVAEALTTPLRPDRRRINKAAYL